MGPKNGHSHIRGWGADLDHRNRPAYPKERKPPRLENVHWSEPEQQLQQVKVLHSLARAGLTSVFGSTLPPTGLSGFIRAQAYKLSENDVGHWLLLLFADRVNAVEGLVDDVRRSPRGRVVAGLAGAAAIGGLGYLLYRRLNKRR